MLDKDFIKEYLKDFSDLLKPDDQIVKKIIEVKDLLIQTKKNGTKIMIFGNGGSAAIASHFSVDLTKNANIRCVNFNESDLITCFSNDYGFDHWVEKAVDFYGDEGDLLILISSSGKKKQLELDQQLDNLLYVLCSEMGASKAAKLAAKITGIDKKYCYQRAIEL